jgi:hypothetical protein
MLTAPPVCPAAGHGGAVSAVVVTLGE